MEKSPIGRVYLYETVGTLAGGVLFTLFLAGRYHTMELAVFLAVLHLLGALYLFLLPPRANGKRGTAWPAVAAVCFVLFLAAVPNISTLLHELSLQRQWRGQEVVHYENSPYGNIVVVQSQNEYTFFYDGRPLITVPFPDTAMIADYIHITAAAHPAPEEVLLLGSGPGGALYEMLKHPVRRVTYVELDPYLPEVVAAFPTPLTEKELGDPQVSVERMDGRLYLSREKKKFDLIVLGFITPETLQSNRLFTAEFFSLAAERLREGGILAFTAPGSDVYLSPELLFLNGSLYWTLREYFRHVEVVSGEQHIFLASNFPLLLCPSALEGRLQERGLCGSFITEAYLQYRFDPYRGQRLQGALLESRAHLRLNYDLNPAGLYYALLYWGSAFSPGALRFLAALEKVAFWQYLFLVLAVSALLFIFMAWYRRPGLMLAWAICTSGSAGMAFDLLLLFVLQCLYGFVYQMMGLLVAFFMLGTFLGGAWSLGRSGGPGETTFFLRLEGGVIALLGAFYPFALLLQSLAGRLPGGMLFTPLALYGLVSGLVVGAQFPSAAELLSPGKVKTGEVAGLLYTADLLGGWGAGLLISLVLFPLLGLWQTLLLLAAAKLGSLAILACNTGALKKRG